MGSTRLEAELRQGPFASRNNLLIAHLKVISIHIDRIHEAQNNDLKLVKLKQKVRNGLRTDFQMKDNDVLIMRNRLCVSQDEELRKMILEEAHSTPYTMHLGSVKMYRTFKEHYGWQGMKRDIVEFVSRCLVS